ncbi:hypothetical protein EIN_133980, partial [Entamoeba invadens IP1]
MSKKKETRHSLTVPPKRITDINGKTYHINQPQVKIIQTIEGKEFGVSFSATLTPQAIITEASQQQLVSPTSQKRLCLYKLPYFFSEMNQQIK